MTVEFNVAKLIALRRAIAAATDRGIARAAVHVRDLARDLAPVDTGALKASGKLTPSPGSGNGEYVVSFGGGDVNYAAFVEYGTPNSSAQPFLRPAVDAIDVAAEVAAELRKIV